MNYQSILNKKSDFYKVEENKIKEAESILGFPLPNELKNFYREVGYGFVNDNEYNINRLMDPLSVSDFRLRREEYEYMPEIDYYDDYKDNKLIFFKNNESTFFSMELKETGKCKIYWLDDVIAHSLSEFLVRYQENPDYFFDLTE